MSEFRDPELAWAWSCAEARNNRICELLTQLANKQDIIVKQIDLLKDVYPYIPTRFADKIDALLADIKADIRRAQTAPDAPLERFDEGTEEKR